MAGIVKKTFAIMLCSAILTVSGCTFLMHNEIEENAKGWMEIIKDGDEEALFNIFCEDIRLNYEDETKEAIKQMFEYLEGDIVSHEYYEGGGERRKRDGKVCYYSCSPTFQNVQNEEGKKCTIRFTYHYIDDEHPETVGVTKLIIYNEDNEKEIVIGRNYES